MQPGLHRRMPLHHCLHHRRQIATQMAARAQEQGQHVEARAPFGHQGVGGVVKGRGHELQIGQPHRQPGLGPGQCCTDGLEGLGPARVARTMGKQDQAGLHRYLTSHANAAIDSSR
jgi:hypothetical protein